MVKQKKRKITNSPNTTNVSSIGAKRRSVRNENRFRNQDPNFKKPQVYGSSSDADGSSSSSLLSSNSEYVEELDSEITDKDVDSSKDDLKNVPSTSAASESLQNEKFTERTESEKKKLRIRRRKKFSKNSKNSDEHDDVSSSKKWLEDPSPEEVSFHTKSGRFKVAHGAKLKGFMTVSIHDLSRNFLHKTRLVSCVVCSQFFYSPGGHLSRHRKNCTKPGTNGDESTPDFNGPAHRTDKSDVKNAIAEYFIKSGESIARVDSEAFRDFTAKLLELGQNCENGEHFDELIPKKDSVRTKMGEDVDKVMEHLRNKLDPFIKEGTLSLLLDFGKVGHDFMCLKAVVIEERLVENEEDELMTTVKWNFTVYPLAATPIFDCSKDSEKIHEKLKETFESFGWGVDDLKKCVLTADGAQNMRKTGTQFLMLYIRCVSHMVNLISEHAFKPYKRNKSSTLSQDDIDNLEVFQEMIDNASHIASKYQKNVEVKKRLKLGIKTVAPTRWFTNFDCLKSVHLKFDNLIGNKLAFDSDTQLIMDKMNSPESRTRMSMVIDVLQPLKDLCVYTQKDCSLIGEMLPVMVKMLKHYGDKTAQSMNQEERTLCRSIVDAMIFNFCDFTEIHCLATVLTPRRKDVVEIQTVLDKYKVGLNILQASKLAIQKFKDSVTFPQNVKRKTCLEKQNDGSKKSVFSQIVDNDYSNDRIENRTIEDEFEKYLMNEEQQSIEDFWPQHKTKFPLLYLLAKKVFACAASQSSVERSFSLIKSVFRNNRQNLNPEFIEQLLVSFEATKTA